MKFNRFAIIPALFTMFDANDNLDAEAQVRCVDRLIAKGVDGLYIAGATGKGFLMTPEERKEVIRVSVDAAKHRVPCICYTGAIDTKTAVDISKYAESVGADAVSSVRPHYGAFTQAEVKQYYKDVSESVGIPLLVYNNPNAVSGMGELIDILSLPNVCGAKYTLSNHFEMGMIKQSVGGKLVFSGCDEMIYSAMMLGVDGAIGSTYNIAPELFQQMRTAFETGSADDEKRLSNAIVRFVRVLFDNQIAGAMKACGELLGFGSRRVRSPKHTLTDAEVKALFDDLRKLKKEYQLENIELFERL